MERSAYAATSGALRREWLAPAEAGALPGSCGIQKAQKYSRLVSGPTGCSGYLPPGDSPIEGHRSDTRWPPAEAT
eukprot:6268080-Heterocapsa_arctica.AAC.1